MKKIIIYTTNSCPYCIKAKALLNSKKVAYEEINVEDDVVRNTMTQITGGKRSVPQIFIGDLYIGGCDDLYALESKGELNSLFK